MHIQLVIYEIIPALQFFLMQIVLKFLIYFSPKKHMNATVRKQSLD